MSAPAGGPSLGAWRSRRELAPGASGARVFEADGPGGHAALKLFPPDGVAACEREAAALRTLDHPAWPRLLQQGAEPPTLAMSWAPGAPLSAESTAGRAGLVAAQVFGALAHLHARGLAHGDLKPANVHVDERGCVTMVDLGFAARLDRPDASAPVGGSPAYLAPERLNGAPPSAASDVFAAGASLVETLAGPAALQRIRQGRGEDVRVPEPARAPVAVLLECCALDPPDRPAAADVLARLLPSLPEPLPAFAAHLSTDATLRSAGPAPSSDVAEPPLVGREGAMGALAQLLRATGEGRGGFVVVSSEAGLGRTRLMHEAIARAAEHGVHAVHGRCRPTSAGPGAWGEILDALVASLGDKTAAEIAEIVPPDARSLGAASAAILELPCVRNQPEPPDLSPDLNKFRVFSAMTALLRAWSRREPLAIFMDDIQWADAATLELAWYLVRNVVHGERTFGQPDAAGALSLVIFRRMPPDGEHELLERTLADARRTGASSEITLQRLAPDQVRDLVAGMLPGSPVPKELVSLIAAESGGAPQVAVELVRSLHAEGVVRRVRGEWRFAAGGGAPAGQLADMLRRRLERTDATARRLLAAASVLGADFDLPLAAIMAGLTAGEVARADRELLEQRLIHRVSDDRRAFAHEHLRLMVSGELEPDDRAQLHLAAARALQAPDQTARGGAAEIARHCVEGGDTGGALRHLPVAAAERRAAGNAGEALELLRTQLALLDELPRDERRRRLPESLAARQAVAEILQRASRYDEATAAWLDMLGACRGAADVAAEARALIGLGLTSNLAGRYAEGQEHLERGLHLARETRSPRLIVAAHAYLVQNAYMRGRFDEGEVHAAAVRENVRELSDRVLVAEALRQLGLFAHFRGKSEEAIGLYREALQLLTEVGDRSTMAATLHNLGILHNARGEHHVALDCYERSLAIFREMGLRMEQAKCLSNVGNVHLQQGAATEAERCYLAAQAIYRELDDRRSTAENLCNLGEADLKRGRPASARARFEQALAIHRDLQNPAGIAQACYELGVAHLSVGRLDEAREMIAEALEHDREVGSPRGLAYDLAASAQLLQLQDRPEEALVEATAALDQARAAGDRYHATVQAAELASLLLEVGKPREALAQATQAHLEATSLGAREVEAQALLVMARCGPTSMARERLERALDLAARSENPEFAWRAWHAAARTMRESRPREAIAAMDRSVDFIAQAARRLGEEAPGYLARRDVRAVLDDALALEERASPPRGETVLGHYHLLTTDEQRSRAKQLLATGLSGGLSDPGELRRLRLFRETVLGSSLLSADTLVQAFLGRALESVEAERGLLFLLKDDELTCRAAVAAGGGPLAAPERDVPRQVVEWVLRERQGLFAPDASADKRLQWKGSIADLRVKSLMACPLLHDSEILGVLYVDRRARGSSFPARARADFEAIAADLTQLLVIAQRAETRAQESAARSLAAEPEDALPGMVGESPAMQRLASAARVVADSTESVLITGESGTGKEVLARALHARSRRARGPFVAIDCGAIPASLMESVLFGHVKGAFTGADRDKAGVFEEAEGGTLLLDEITNASLDLQARLLRVLQEREVRRVGGRGSVEVDVRVMAATNLDIEAEVAAGRFRQDLYWRLNVIHLHLPPLRDRPEDIPLLAEHVLRQIVEREKKPLEGFTEDAMRLLVAHPWPGNIRELGNCVARMAAFASAGRLGAERIPEGVRDRQTRPLKVRLPSGVRSGDEPAPPALEDLLAGRTDFWSAVRAPLRAKTLTRAQAREVVAEGLRRTSGSYKETARLFGLPDDDYGRFMDFLRFNKLKLDFRPFRAGK